MPRKRAQDWSPRGRGPAPRVPELQKIPVDMVGDGGSPNVFFVTRQGDVQLISIDFEAAYSYWKSISRQRDYETALEDRQHGVLASNGEEELEDGSIRWMRVDDTGMLLRGDA